MNDMITLLSRYLSGETKLNEKQKTILNNQLQNINYRDNTYDDILDLFMSKFGWGGWQLDFLIENNVQKFFDVLNDTQDIKKAQNELDSKLKLIYPDESFFGLEELRLLELKDNQIIYIKSLLNIFVGVGDFDNLNKERLDGSELSKILNDKIGSDLFTYDNNSHSITFKPDFKSEFDIRYVCDDGKVIFIDLTSDSTGGEKHDSNLNFNNQPIVKNFELYKKIIEEENILDSDYYFIPNIINRFDSALAENMGIPTNLEIEDVKQDLSNEQLNEFGLMAHLLNNAPTTFVNAMAHNDITMEEVFSRMNGLNYQHIVDIVTDIGGPGDTFKYKEVIKKFGEKLSIHYQG